MRDVESKVSIKGMAVDSAIRIELTRRSRFVGSPEYAGINRHVVIEFGGSLSETRHVCRAFSSR